MADLVRAVDVPIVCTFIKPRYKQTSQGEAPVLEIFFSHELDIKGKHVLLVEGLVHWGVTTEFLMSDLKARGRQLEEFSSLQQARDAYEREYILKKIEEAHNNISHAAELLGLERSHLYRKMKALGIAARE